MRSGRLGATGGSSGCPHSVFHESTNLFFVLVRVSNGVKKLLQMQMHREDIVVLILKRVANEPFATVNGGNTAKNEPREQNIYRGVKCSLSRLSFLRVCSFCQGRCNRDVLRSPLSTVQRRFLSVSQSVSFKHFFKYKHQQELVVTASVACAPKRLWIFAGSAPALAAGARRYASPSAPVRQHRFPFCLQPPELSSYRCLGGIARRAPLEIRIPSQF